MGGQAVIVYYSGHVDTEDKVKLNQALRHFASEVQAISNYLYPAVHLTW